MLPLTPCLCCETTFNTPLMTLLCLHGIRKYLPLTSFCICGLSPILLHPKRGGMTICAVNVQLLRMEGGADAVAQAVAVAVAARDAELAALQRHAAELEGHLESVMHEAQEVQQESLDMRDHVVRLESALRESEAKKCGF